MKTLKPQTCFIIAFVIVLSCMLNAQDAKGSKDHPLFNRMPGYRITGYKEHDFNVYNDFFIEKGKNI